MIGNRKLLLKFVMATAAAVVMVAVSAGYAFAASKDATCSGGSIASGIYSNLKIAGACNINAGSVTVRGDLTVLPGGSLEAVTGGSGAAHPSSDLRVGGNVYVEAGGLFNLGCKPHHDTCINDPNQQVPTFSTHDTIAGNLVADDAFALVVHHTVIGGNVSVSGGGGGTDSCLESIPALEFAPPYGDIEDDVVGGNLFIAGWNSCWLGVIRATVLGNTDFVSNTSGDPDGNEVAGNTVFGNLSCNGNSPHPQIGDSMGGPTTVLGNANGQCSLKPGLVVH